MENDAEILIALADIIYNDYTSLLSKEKIGTSYKKGVEKLEYDRHIFEKNVRRVTTDYSYALQVYRYIISLVRFKNSVLASKDLKLSFSLKFDSRDDMVLLYVKNRIYQKLMSNPDYVWMVTQGLPKDVSYEEEIEVFKKIFVLKNEFQYALINDIYTLYLTIIEELKTKTSNEMVLEKFARAKYTYSLILPSIEDYLGNTSFEVSSKPYITHQFLVSFNPFLVKYFANSKGEIIWDIVAGNLEMVKHLCDANFGDYQRLFLAINVEATIRACLVVADKETQDLILRFLKTFIANLEVETCYQTIGEILKKIPDKMESDRSLVQIVMGGR